MPVHALAHAVLAFLRDEARNVILLQEIVQVMIGLQDDAAAATAIAAARSALGHKRLAMKSHAAFAAMARLRVNFYFVNEHAIILQPVAKHGSLNLALSKNSPLFPN